MLKKASLLSVSLSLAGVTLQAGELPASTVNGDALLTECSEITDRPPEAAADSSTGGSYCLGMVNGMMNLNYIYQSQLGNQALFCLPDDIVISNIEAARVVVGYLKEHPEELHEDPASLMFFAFQKTYPCR